MSRRRWWQRGHVWSAAFLLVLAALCFLAPVDPFTLDTAHVYQGPTLAHWLGTDDLGRDVLARLLYGGRVSLMVGVIGAVTSIVLGGAVGLTSGYFGGSIDAITTRIIEGVMSLPRLPLMIVMLAIDFDKLGLPDNSTLKLILIIVLFGWTSPARLARGAAQQIREQPYIEAARAVGASDARILWRHVLPNAAAPLIVAATIDVGQIILYENVLSFLGLGVQPPTPSWGALLQNGMTYLHTAPALLIMPGLLAFATVAAVSSVGDGLRAALDPRTRDR